MDPLYFYYISTIFISDLFADDATVHTNYENADNIGEDITQDFNKALNWSKPNFGKNICMLLGTRQRLNMSQKINVRIARHVLRPFPNKNFSEFISTEIGHGHLI